MRHCLSVPHVYNGAVEYKTHSVRVSDQTWESWQKLASELGLSVTKTLGFAMNLLAGSKFKEDGSPAEYSWFPKAGEKAE